MPRLDRQTQGSRSAPQICFAVEDQLRPVLSGADFYLCRSWFSCCLGAFAGFALAV